MSIRKWLFAGALALSAAGFSSLASAEDKTIRLGVVSGPDAQIWEFVQKNAAEKGLKIELKEFADYVIPNEALSSGDIDANAFQHLPYLEAQIKSRGYKLVPVGLTYTAPIGFFSKKYKKWEDIPEGATIAIPNDPTNGGRSLLALQSNQVVKLADGVELTPGVLDIVENPKKFKFIEIDAAATPRALDDVDVAAVNNSFAVPAGLDLKNALIREPADSPYANIVAVQEKDKDAPWVKQMIEILQTPETAEFILETFKGSTIPAWVK